MSDPIDPVDNTDGLDLEDAKQGTTNNANNGSGDSISPLDKTDAHGFFPSMTRHQSEYPAARLTVEHDSIVYSMKNTHRGKCIIFNHRCFDSRTRLSERKGTEKDAESLKDCFARLDFDVEMIQDATAIEIKAKLKSLSLEISNDDECLIICVLTHGERGLLWARDQVYQVDELYQHFTADKCAPLAGKPKLFFVQACQGSNFDKGAIVRGALDVTDGPSACYKIPIWADFMIVYSTIPGFYSWRNPAQGSWFIQALTSIINKYAHSMDLLSMLTLVNRKVAYDFESNCPGQGDFDGNKQVPCVTSMLTRKIYFTSSRSPSNTVSAIAD